MTLHLAEISAAVAPGAHATRLLVQAGWQDSGALIVPATITLLPLPAKCSELNPVENVWQFTRHLSFVECVQQRFATASKSLDPQRSRRDLLIAYPRAARLEALAEGTACVVNPLPNGNMT